MKKKIYLLLTLFLSFFVFSSSVEAVKSLGCIYDGTANFEDLLFVQGNSWNVYYNNGSDLTNPDWVHIDVDDYDFGTGYENFYDEASSTVSRCPEYVKYDKGNKKIIFADEYNFHNYGYFAELEEQYFSDNEYSHIFDDSSIFYSNQNDIYKKIVSETEWTAECSYSGSTDDGSPIKVYLYFNNDRYILINETYDSFTNSVNFTLSQLNDYFEEVLYNCPPRLYMRDSGGYGPFGYFYLYNPGRSYEILNDDNKVNIFVPEPPTQDETDEDIDDCKDLFGEDLVKKINDVMDIVKIVVPILLIVLGIVDFTKAMFSGSSDNMTKSQKTFFKRIVAAILVFIAPIFINLILDIANNVWGDIKSDTCISQNE